MCASISSFFSPTIWHETPYSYFRISSLLPTTPSETLQGRPTSHADLAANALFYFYFIFFFVTKYFFFIYFSIYLLNSFFLRVILSFVFLLFSIRYPPPPAIVSILKKKNIYAIALPIFKWFTNLNFKSIPAGSMKTNNILINRWQKKNKKNKKIQFQK